MSQMTARLEGALLYSLVSLFLSWVRGHAAAGVQTQCSGGKLSPAYRLFSTRTTYDTIRGRVVKTDQVPGCEAQQIYMVSRHGTRYPGWGDIEDMQTFLPLVRHYVLQNADKVSLCPEEIESIRHWKPKMIPSNDLGMTPVGMQEMYGIASRFRQRYPKLLNTTDADFSLLVKHTENPRCKASAEQLIKGLHENGDMDTSKALQLDEFLLIPCDNCKKYLRERISESDREKGEGRNFDNGIEIRNMIDDLTNRLSLPAGFMNLTVVLTMYEACRFEYAIHDESTWCNVFTSDQLKLLEYRQDMKYYWRYGYGRKVNYESSCIIAKDVFQSFKNIIANASPAVNGVFFVGHSRTTLPLLARLGLYKDTTPLTAENYMQNLKRKWKLSKINPFSSNVAFVLYKCGSEYFMRTYVNEIEVILPGCSSTFCSFKSIMATWTPMVDQCDFQNLCEDGLGHLDLKNITFDLHHL